MRKFLLLLIVPSLFFAAAWSKNPGGEQNPATATDLDTQIRRFLDNHRGTWHDMNVPSSDGQALYDLIIRHKFINALEIGTSTGHSGIWIAWALSKTGGKLVTIDIDKDRHEQALVNFRNSGVAKFIDARLGDAHELVPALKGPFDFVFCDADKDWLKNYLTAMLPKLSAGGCFVAHNISERGYEAGYSREFLRFARSLPDFETSLITGGSGMSVSCRKAQ